MFYLENHEYLLNPELNLVASLLLPLAGPEEFDDEDNDKLPLDLQYLPTDKIRESEPTIRKALLEIIMQVIKMIGMLWLQYYEFLFLHALFID